MQTSEYRLRLFNSQTHPRPIYARFALCASTACQGMKILRIQHGDSRSIRPHDVAPSFRPIQFCRNPAALAGVIKYPHALYAGKVFHQRNRLYVCLSIEPSLPSYKKYINKKHTTTLEWWTFTETSLRTLRRLPVAGFNPKYDAVFGAIR